MKFNNITKFRKGIIFLLLLSLYTSIEAQQWAVSMQDPEISFFEVQRQFNEYFKDKTYEKGKGWKQFKRWEYFMEDRVDKNGFFTHAEDAYKVYKDIQQNHLARMSQGSAGKWKSLGPNGSTIASRSGAGRLNCIAFHPTNDNFLVVGAASGGIWYSTDNGNSWHTTTDDMATLGISDIEYSQSNPNIVYAATGDKDGSDTYSIGVIKSTDGGKHWSPTNMNWGANQRRLIHRVLVHPTNPDIVYASSSVGIYKTTDGGNTWTRLRPGSFKDMEFKPGNPNTIYAATTSGLMRSTNAGVSFSALSVGFATGVSRVEIAVTPANANYLYVVAGKSSDGGFAGLYLSTDGGNTFTTKSTTPNILGWQSNGMDNGGQAWYDLAITVSPTNPNLIFVGGVNIWRSTNAGSTWAIKAHWRGSGAPYVHADIHELAYANNGTTLWACSDGGAYYGISNASSAWGEKNNGLAIAQMYRMGASATNAKKILSGWQDNGSSKYTGSWYKVLGGDGMECIIDHSNNNIMYASMYYGNIYRSADGGSNWVEITNSINEQGDWVTPYVMHPTVANILYAGYINIYKSVNRGNSWSKLTNFGGSAKIKALAIAPSNPSIMYLSTKYDVKRSTDGGVTWSSISNGINGSVTYFAIHPTNPNTVWVTLSGYSSGYKVMKTTNGGQSWQNISGNLPNLPANCIVYEKNTANGIYVGMDVGVYYRDDNLGQWVPFMKDLPNVIVDELEIFYPDHKIRAATFGRGMWESPVYSLANDINSPEKDQYTLEVYPNPTSGIINVDLKNPGHSEIQVRVLNYSGQVLKTLGFEKSSTIQIPVEELSKGLYFIEVQIGNNFYFGRFIRQ